MLNPEEYFFLESVSNGRPLDFLYFNLGHTLAHRREDLQIDPGAVVIIFENDSYDIYLDKTKWVGAGRSILKQLIATDERIAAWEKKTKEWLLHSVHVNEEMHSIQPTSLTVEELCSLVDLISRYQTAHTYENAELTSTNYGTNLIQKELATVLQECGITAPTVIPSLLKTDAPFPFAEYEEEVTKLALTLYSQRNLTSINSHSLTEDEDLRSKIDFIFEKYDWLDAGISNPPKSIEQVVNDVNAALSLGTKLETILYKKESQKAVTLKERDVLLAQLSTVADARQKRVIEFAIQSAEYGRVLVDEEMRSIFYVRKIYTEIAARVGLLLEEVKYLSHEEIKAALRGDDSIKQVARERRTLSVFILEDGEMSVQTGLEARTTKSAFDACRDKSASEDKEMKGEVAFSAGVVRGVARLIANVQDIPKLHEGEILISSRTYPDLLPAMKKSAAIISELGSLLSHAAIVAREFKIPGVVGVKNATRLIADGDLVEVNTETGIVKILKEI